MKYQDRRDALRNLMEKGDLSWSLSKLNGEYHLQIRWDSPDTHAKIVDPDPTYQDRRFMPVWHEANPMDWSEWVLIDREVWSWIAESIVEYGDERLIAWSL